MSKLSPILAPEADRAHYVAQITLCTLAAGLIGSLAWAGWKGAFPGLTHSVQTQGAISGSAVPSSPIATTKNGAITTLPSNVTPVDSLPVPTKKEPSPVASSTLPPAPVARYESLPPASVSTLPPLPPVPAPLSSGPSSSAKPISNAQARDLVEKARSLRSQGKTFEALESLRAADLQESQHPEILSEMALTYELMKLNDRAESKWREVLALGEAGAGSFYYLAKKRLEGIQDSSKTLASGELKPLSIGSCQILPDPKVTKGQRLTLRIPIIAVPGANIDPLQVDLRVFFFDKLSDGRMAITHADTPITTWVTPPVDWKDNGEELVDVTYYMPELTPDELRNLGKRSYGGYIVKLLYQNQAMAEKADPPQLLNFSPQGAGPAGMDNALFPKN